jgi:hypothetical protein
MVSMHTEPRFASPPTSLEESGRGLGIVTGLSVRCGTTVIENGHRVWADLTVS